MSVEERLTEHLAAEAAAVAPVPDLLDRVKRQRARRSRRLQVVGTAAKSVLIGSEVMNIHGQDTIGTHGFKQRRDIARCHRIAGLGFPVFACVAKVRNDGGHARC